ncbi:Pr6Pr family membrane protein [Microbacterium marinilacus]|uniref:Integral membrane regulator n=1 Tax=Microbacterium marinilacus TaxID=415209 RepID=A0ABP7B4V6_9MICO|nr:Pr6Pr family membrane protein [Microbacterium marinilacus]MBY0687894.1 Pr6Pr family membrane protein [Microbacterium marinilacus]
MGAIHTGGLRARDRGEAVSTAWSALWNVARLAVVVAIVLATIEQGRLAIAAAEGAGLPAGTALARLFSFFTVQSNVLAATVLAAVAVRAFVTRFRADGPVVATALVAVSAYMLVTGIVYNVVLRAAGGTDIMTGWSNDVHHVLAPAFLLLDVLIGPGRTAVRWRAVLIALAYPLVWVACTLLLGPFLVSPSTGMAPWYPYPFLDPASAPDGYVAVGVWVAGIAALIAALAALVVLTGRLRGRRAARRVRARDRPSSAG